MTIGLKQVIFVTGYLRHSSFYCLIVFMKSSSLKVTVLFLQNRVESAISPLILGVFLLAPFWLRWADASPPFTADYTLGYVVIAPMLLTIVFWAISGFPNASRLVSNRWRTLWVISLFAVVAWAFASQGWAFARIKYGGVAQSATLLWAVVALFCVVIVCYSPSPRYVIAILGINLVLHSLIGALQVAQQSHIGLKFLGEFTLDVAKSGVSVVESGDWRWLRPYGLLPHPNLYAGVLLCGLFAMLPWLLSPHRIIRWGALAGFAGAWWVFLLTFSRGAWVAFGLIGGIIGMYALIRARNRAETALYRHLWATVVVLLTLTVGFAVIYQPFLRARAGIGEENTELRSIADRVVFTQIALDSIQRVPIQGVGIGNFPFYASRYLITRTDYDLRGNNVHHVWLTVWAELGLIGLGLWGIMLFSGVISVLVGLKKQFSWEKVALVGAFLALGVVGWVDHYPITLPIGLIYWLGTLAVAMGDTP